MRIALVVSRYHAFVTEPLEAGARAALARGGRRRRPTSRRSRCRAPTSSRRRRSASPSRDDGPRSCAWAASFAARRRTSTTSRRPPSHGIMRAAQATGVPVAFGVLTTNTAEEALARAGERAGEQGTRGGARGAWRWRGCTRASTRRRRRDDAARAVTTGPGTRRARPRCRSCTSGKSAAPRPMRRSRRSSPSTSPTPPEALRAFAADLVHGTIAEIARARRARSPRTRANWRLDRLAVIDRLILRMAVWELRHEPDTPAAGRASTRPSSSRGPFSTDDSVRFVNGVLDAIRKDQA